MLKVDKSFTDGLGGRNGEGRLAAAVLHMAQTLGLETVCEGIEREEQLEAARGLGMSYGQAMRYSIVPQAVRRVIPPLMNEFVILVKDTSLVVFLGLAAGERDLLTVATQGFGNTFNSTFYIFAAIGYLAICLPAMWLVNRVERRLRSGLVGITA